MLQCYDFNILVYSVISSSAPDNVWGGDFIWRGYNYNYVESAIACNKLFSLAGKTYILVLACMLCTKWL